jgi:tetratricopeptide (TPR) repeat protein
VELNTVGELGMFGPLMRSIGKSVSSASILFVLVVGCPVSLVNAKPQETERLDKSSAPPHNSDDRTKALQELRSLYMVAQVLFKTDDFKGAEDAYRKIVEGLRALDSTRQTLGEGLFGLATIQVKSGNLTGARASYEEALVIRNDIDPQGASVVATIQGLAALATLEQDFATAERRYLEEEAILAKRVPGSVAEISCLDDLARSAFSQKADDRAQRYLERAESSWASRVGDYKRRVEIDVIRPDSSTADSTRQITAIRRALEEGQAAGAQGDEQFHASQFGWAVRWYQRSLLMFEAIYPEGHETAEVNFRIGVAFYKMKDLLQAEKFTRISVDIREGIDSDGLEFATSLSNLGFILRDLGRRSEAEECHLHAASIRQKLTPKSSDLSKTYRVLAELYQKDGKATEASKYYHLALEAIGVDEAGLSNDEVIERLAKAENLLKDAAKNSEIEAETRSIMDRLAATQEKKE